MIELIGRKGLARILDVTEEASRNIERRGEISPVTYIDGRPVFSAAMARELRAQREARKASGAVA